MQPGRTLTTFAKQAVRDRAGKIEVLSPHFMHGVTSHEATSSPAHKILLSLTGGLAEDTEIEGRAHLQSG